MRYITSDDTNFIKLSEYLASDVGDEYSVYKNIHFKLSLIGILVYHFILFLIIFTLSYGWFITLLPDISETVVIFTSLMFTLYVLVWFSCLVITKEYYVLSDEKLTKFTKLYLSPLEPAERKVLVPTNKKYDEPDKYILSEVVYGEVDEIEENDESIIVKSSLKVCKGLSLYHPTIGVNDEKRREVKINRKELFDKIETDVIARKI